jgi:hypothetical protein
MRVKERKVVKMGDLTLIIEGTWMTTWKDGTERGALGGREAVERQLYR